MKQAHIQLVCDMNNTGVDFLVVGLFHSARVVFAEAIEAAKLILIEDDNDNTNENCARATGTETSHFADSLFQSCTINTPYFADEKYGASLAVDITNSPSSEDGIFVYHRAFKLRYHHYDVPRLQSVCTVILYNMVSCDLGLSLLLCYIDTNNAHELFYSRVLYSTCRILQAARQSG